MPPAFTTPPPVSPGDRVAVVAPSSGGATFAPDVRDLGLRRLRETFDLDPVLFPTAETDDEYLAANPEARARDLHDAFRDPEVRAVVATIGGDDGLRVLRHLDPAVLREHPTRFFGMSDNTNVQLFLWNLGVVSYNGGQLMNQVATPGRLPEYTERYLRRGFFDASLGKIAPADEWTDEIVEWTDPEYETTEPEYEPNEGWRWHAPVAGDGDAGEGDADPVEGRVWGGCLAIVRWQLATGRYLPEPEALDGQVLAVETAEDLPGADRVKRALMCMGERGILERFDAVLVGRPQTRNRFEDPGPEARERFRAGQREAILGEMERYDPDATVVFDLDFGHTNPTIPLPIGGRVRIDPAEESIVFG